MDTKSLTEQTDNRIERNASFYNSNRMPFGGGKEKNRCSEGLFAVECCVRVPNIAAVLIF